MAETSTYQPPDLRNCVVLVAGATRGVGRGIALAFGEAGATVYCTGRSSRAKRRRTGSKKSSPFDLARRPETVEETADVVTARGGKGIAVIVDHLESKQVERLIARIRKEQKALHILVNDIWGGDQYAEFGKTVWQVDLEKGFAMIRSAVDTHIITSHFALPLLIETAKENGTGLVVEITDGDSYTYRGNLFYDLVKTTVIRLAFAQARELRRKNIAAVALTPGFLRSEAMLEHFGVTEADWRKAGKKDENFLESETPLFSGRAVTALAADPNIMKKSGRVFSSWGLSDEYKFCDADGGHPHWGRHVKGKYGDCMNSCDEKFYQYWFGGPMDTIYANWP